MIRFAACVLLLLTFLGGPAYALDVTVKVSSFKVDFGLPYAPEHLLDGDATSAWAGGGVSSGVGQWIELDFGMAVRVERLGIFNGHQGEGQFDKFRRIRSGRIVYPDGVETKFWLRDEPGEQVIECRGVAVKTLRIVVDKVFPKGALVGNKKLAVSEVKLYLSMMESPDAIRSGDGDKSAAIMAKPPADPDYVIPEDLAALLHEFYVRHTSLADNYAELFAKDVRDQNDFQFEVFKELQRQQGTYALLRSAKVDTSGLGFEMVEREGEFAKVRIFGGYVARIDGKAYPMDEDSTFVVVEDPEGWRILELEGQPF